MITSSELPSPSEWGWNRNVNDGWTTLSESTQASCELLRNGCNKGTIGLCKCLKRNINALLFATVVDCILVANVWHSKTLGRVITRNCYILHRTFWSWTMCKQLWYIHTCYMHIELSHRLSRFRLWNVSADMPQNNDSIIVIPINNELNLHIVLKVIKKIINSKKGTICDTPL